MKTDDGTLSDLDFQPLQSVWDQVASDSDNCLGRRLSLLRRLLFLPVAATGT
jgi:hypothetical protein